MKKHIPLNLNMNHIYENKEIIQGDSFQQITMEITKSNIGEIGYDYLKSKLEYNKDLSSYTERLIENEIKVRKAEMDKYLFAGLNNLSIDVLFSLKSKTNRYPVEFENQIKSAIFNRNENRAYKQNNNKKNNSWVVLSIFAFIGICAVMTNPNSERHKEVIKNKLYSLMQESIKEKTKESNNKWESLGQGLGMLFGKPIIDNVVENLISTDNYVFFSTTKINWEGDTRIIGIGAFGNVFLTSKLDDAINDGLLKNK